MSDIQHLADGRDRVWIFRGTSKTGNATSNPDFQTWKKSWVKGCSFLAMTCIGMGGNGGNGFVKSVGAAGGGGGGGGGGSVTRALFSLDQLPDTLFIAAPQAGDPTSATCFVAISPRFRDYFVSAAPGSNGAAGTNSIGGTGGGGANAVSLSNTNLVTASLGWQSIAGGSGGTGGAHTGANGNVGSTSVGMYLGNGGGGGAGSTSGAFTGGLGGSKTTQSTTGVWPVLISGPAGSSVGSHGYEFIMNYLYPLSASGGNGGDSTDTAVTTGGQGGNGGIGCGGGGGGAGTLASALGGKGGDAAVIISCW